MPWKIFLGKCPEKCKMSWKNVSEISGQKFWPEKEAKISGPKFLACFGVQMNRPLHPNPLRKRWIAAGAWLGWLCFSRMIYQKSSKAPRPLYLQPRLNAKLRVWLFPGSLLAQPSDSMALSRKMTSCPTLHAYPPHPKLKRSHWIFNDLQTKIMISHTLMIYIHQCGMFRW